MRDLTIDELAVLAHDVVDPAAWWVHCQTVFRGNPEAALAARISGIRSADEAVKDQPGYKNRADRDLAAIRPLPPVPDIVLSVGDRLDLLEAKAGVTPGDKLARRQAKRDAGQA